jgi:hypothetical protein
VLQGCNFSIVSAQTGFVKLLAETVACTQNRSPREVKLLILQPCAAKNSRDWEHLRKRRCLRQ